MEQLMAPSWITPPFHCSSISKGLISTTSSRLLPPSQKSPSILTSASSGFCRSCGSSVQVSHKDQHIEESGSGLVLFKLESLYSQSESPMHQRRNRISFEAANHFPEVIECEEYTVTCSMLLQEESDTTAFQQVKRLTTQNNDSKPESSSRDHHTTIISTMKNTLGHQVIPKLNHFLDTSIDVRYAFLIKGEQYVPGMNHIRLRVSCPDDLYCGCGDILTSDRLHDGIIDNMKVQIEDLLMDNASSLNENVHMKGLNAKGVSLTKPSTIRRSEKSSSKKERSKDKAKQKIKSRKVPDRDLFKSSTFQLYEVVFVYPFLESSDAALNWKALPKENLGEIFDVLNHLAVGLGGTGLALVLLVVSRMLCLNATLDSTKIAYLLRGMGLMWLSSGLKKFGSIVKHMSDFYVKTRLERKEQLIKYKEEMQAISFRVCLLVILTIVG